MAQINLLPVIKHMDLLHAEIQEMDILGNIPIRVPERFRPCQKHAEKEGAAVALSQ